MPNQLYKDAQVIYAKCKDLSYTNRLILAAIFSGLAAALQSAGALFPGVGYLISPLATAPIIFCSLLSVRLGFLSYLLTILVLLFTYPSELIIFPFTTGLLGLAVGIGLLICSTRYTLITVGGIALVSGIIIVLYGFRFPLLGPTASTAPSLPTIAGIILFSGLYSWLWVLLSKIILNRLKRMLA